MVFANPNYLYLLLLLIPMIGWYVYKLSKSQASLQVSSSEAFEAPGAVSWIVYLRHVPFVLRMVAVALLIVILARPQSTNSWSNSSTEGIDIMLAMDISGSMLAQDLKPNRLEAAKDVAASFINGRPNDNIGLVVFSAESFTQCPLTTDHTVLLNLFKDIQSGMIQDGTAIGLGLANAVSRIKDSHAKSKVIILLTDGSNNAGEIAPVTAAEIAKTFGVRVYTIGVGTKGMAPYPFQTAFGVQYQNIPVEIDEATLKQIASTTGGPEKTGKKFEMKEKKKIGSDVLWVGHNEEPSIRNLFKRNYCKDHPLDIVKVINDCHMYQCGMRDHTGKLLYPFVLCDLDGLVEINGVTGILECKTCNKGSEDYKLWKKHIVPLKYYLQVCWYMLCMNLPYGYIVATWGLLPSECVYIYIERNFDVENLIIKMAQDFLEAVKTKQPPDLNNQNLDRLFVYWRKKMGNPKPDAPVKMLGREYKDTALTLSMIGTSIKDFQQKESDLKKQRRDILTKQIFPVMGQSSEALVDFSPSSNMRIKLHNGSKKMVDSDSLKSYDPELYHQYVKEVFDERLFIEEMTDTDLGDEFIVDSNVLTDSKLEYCEVRLEPKNKK